MIIMANERAFLKESIKKMEIEQYIAEKFAKAGYSHVDIQRTPLAMRITVWAQKPGIIIGRGGKNIDEITEVLKDRFKIENPQLDIEEVPVPDLDPMVVGREIASAIERGLNFKRVANTALERVMAASAKGVAIRLAGKVSGEMSRVEKFSRGYMISAGDPAITKVAKAYQTANVKLGKIGIQVRILKEQLKDIEALQKIKREDVNGAVEKEGDKGDGSSQSEQKS